MRRFFLLVLVILLVISCNHNENKNEWKIVYKNDGEGNTLMGSKINLINAIRQGRDIKIGWGSKSNDHSIEHLSEPIWLAILDEKEIIAHLDPQVLSTIDWNRLSADYKDSLALQQEWRVVITTKGEFDAVWYDRKADSLIERRPQSHVMSWFSKSDTKTGEPLFKE